MKYNSRNSEVLDSGKTFTRHKKVHLSACFAGQPEPGKTTVRRSIKIANAVPRTIESATYKFRLQCQTMKSSINLQPRHSGKTFTE